jgi:hypothetical protein
VVFSRVGAASPEVAEVFGISFQQERSFLTDTFFCWDTHEYEDPGYLPGFWAWMVETIQGEKESLPCSHLVGHVDVFDVAQLFLAVRKFLSAENFQTFGLRVQAFNVCEYAPREDIFVFYNRLSKSVQEVEKMSHLAREVGEDFKIPKFLIMQKLFRGVAQCR